MIYLNRINTIFVFVFIYLSLLTTSYGVITPPYTNYCQQLARDIQGIQHGFLAGRHMYYCGGKTSAEWDVIENETIGFTHPMFRDGRARGHGIVTDAYGTGHDKWGWEYWRNVKIAYGTVIINGKRYNNPVPKKMIWRPDRQICEYQLGDVTIKEIKFISKGDVLCDIIEVSDRVEIEFKGQSFYNNNLIGTFDGDPLTPYSNTSTAKAHYHKKNNAISIIEGGAIIVKPNWGEKAVVGKMMYDGMNVLLTASQDISQSVKCQQQKEGYWSYSFSLQCKPGKPVTLAFAMGDDQADVALRVAKVMHDPQKALAQKTTWFNDLLNKQIPYFRCSDNNVVQTYYYLWSLYFMYFTDGPGWEQYPHTQTAINNFMGLHCWDSWVYSLMGSWVTDKEKWAYGNVLSWQFMVPFKNRNNALPDNFGQAWWSPAWMGIEMVVENAWKQYQQSGDIAFLTEAYDDLFVPLYYDKGPRFGFGIDLIALDALIQMADVLSRKDDVSHWRQMRPGMVKRFQHGWENKHANYYGGGMFRDIWNLAALLSPEMKSQWADRLIKHWITNTETGFWGPVALDVRPPDEVENAVFVVSSISTWLVVEGMFRHHSDAAAIEATLSHLNGMVKDFGYPVAPECWETDYKPWGSMYYNWDGAMIPLIIGRLAGITWSVPDHTFKVSEHLPSSWDYVHTYTPVKMNGEVNWCEVKVSRKKTADVVVKEINVKGVPLEKLVIEPWMENCEVISASSVRNNVDTTLENQTVYKFNDLDNVKVKLTLGRKQKSVPLLVRVTPFDRSFFNTITIDIAAMMASCQIHYTTDGSEPTATSPLYQKRLTFNRTTTLKARAFRLGDTPGPVVTAELVKMPLLEPINVATTQPGIRYHYYEGHWRKLPDFNKLLAVSNGVVNEFDFSMAKRQEDFAIKYDGYLRVEADGLYYFNLKSNDGSQLYIGDQCVVDMNIGTVGRDPWDKTASCALKKGVHKITVLYHQARSTKMLHLSWGQDKAHLKPLAPHY